ncbi:MAG TPA: hypothetical protein VM513_25185 [Kofleriaceae bacterium]|nr:hypothetical protein [Kofleriaceae bacterium]
MAKPDVSISAQNPVFAGQTFTVDFDVTVEKDTKVEFIDARLTGEQGWRIGSGKHRITHQATLPDVVANLMGEGVLPAETTTRFSARFMLPPSTAPTHRMAPAWARLRLKIHISIPWRIDGRYHYEFEVRVPPPSGVQRSPHAVRSTSRQAAHDKPRIELGLASTTLAVGEELVGSCAVFHLDDSEPREVEVSLVPMIHITGRRTREYRGTPVAYTVTLPAGSAGRSVPFRIPVPRALIPTFVTQTHSVAWWLVAQTGSMFRGGRIDVSVPLVLVDASASNVLSPLVAPPRLGDEQVATLFADFAARHGWQGENDAPIDGDFAIAREVADCELTISYAYRGADGTYLVAKLVPPRLGLGLGVTPSSPLRHVFFADVEVDIAAWDRAHHVVARSPAQAIPFLREVVPALMKAERLGRLVRWTDDALVFERPVSSVDASTLAQAAELLELLARTFATARAAIAPPPDVTVELAAWQQVAAKLDGRLTVGDLALDGALDGLPVDAKLVWRDGAPALVHVAVGEPEAASAELRSLDLSLARPAADVLRANAAERLVDSVTRWPLDRANLRVRDGVASAELVLPEGERPVVDATRVRELVEALRGVLATLDPGAGPYR